MIGPGKYDELCTYVREAAKAEGAIVIVIEGEQGPGFSVQLTRELMLRLDLPKMLRNIAAQIEAAQRPIPLHKNTFDVADVISNFDESDKPPKN